MPCQIHAANSYPADTKHAEADRQAEEAAVEAAGRTTDTEASLAITDELLEEIDSILETNAEEFVRNFVQKSGQ